jgi:hypothetical protein
LHIEYAASGFADLKTIAESIQQQIILLVVFPCLALAQDTHYAPKNQLIPAPECLTLKGAWQGGYTPFYLGNT